VIGLFLEEISKIAETVKGLMKEKVVKIVAQFDADGLASAAIFSRILLREGLNFELRIVKQLTPEEIKKLKSDKEKFLVFLDCGSGQLDKLKELIESTKILVIDHHSPVEYKHQNLFHINPLLFGEDELSASLVTYLFAKFFNKRNTDLVDLAIIGAVGDAQDEDRGFTEKLKRIIPEEELLAKVSITKGIRIYGRATRPIFRSLAYTFDPFIPGISGSESNAIQFLSDLGIPLKEGERWRTLNDLTIEEQRKLASAIVLEYLNLASDVEAIFGDVFTLLGYPPDFQDVREFSTVINACSRLGSPEIAFRICLGDFSVMEKTKEILEEYRKVISDALFSIKGNFHIQKENANFFVVGKNVRDTLIGTIISIALRSNLVEKEKPVFGLADFDEKTVKVSARAFKDLGIDLSQILNKAASMVGGWGGGHKYAAGAFIPKGKEEEFINIVNNLLSEMNAGKES
jgi:RecJ-like exonuclease